MTKRRVLKVRSGVKAGCCLGTSNHNLRPLAVSID